MNKKTIKDIDFKGKKVIARLDFNVPLDKQGKITDEARIKAALPTIKYILEHGAAKLILMSHLGRPKGEVVESLRMNPVAESLSRLLGQEVLKLDDCIGEQVKTAIEQTGKQVILLENLRFHAQEKKGDQDFARSLAELADIYVNDAFGTAHRKHASTALINQFLPSALGFLIEKEIVYLSKALKPEKPYMVILGGAKVSDKIDVVKNLIQKADKIIIGGAMAYTFLKSKGENVGSSLVEEDKLDLASTILQEAKTKGTEILLPVDHLAVKDIEQPETRDVFDQIPEGFKGVDIGPKTIEFFRDTLKQAKTVLWNGPLGIFEKQEYSKGTAAIAASLADLEGATVIVGGGDSASAAKQFKVAEKLDHVSTGGGASLTFLEGKELPALAAIADKE